MKAQRLLTLLLGASLLAVPATMVADSVVTVAEGLLAEGMAGCRIKGAWGPDVYLGIDDLGVGDNRVQADAGNPLADGTYPVSFVYDSVENLITLTGPAAVSLSWDFDELGSPESMEWDALVITLRDSKDNGAVAFENVMLNAEPLGNFGTLEVAGTPGYQHWTVTGVDFTQSFTVTADLLVVNLTANEALRAEIWAAEQILMWDFGDAPDPLYPTLLVSDGARHLTGALSLGAAVDAEADGMQSASADGDDVDGSDDEDGVTFDSVLRQAVSAELAVNVSSDGVLNAWIDFNADGDWADAGEQIAADMTVTTGDNALSVPIPPNAAVGSTMARFRLSTQAGLGPTGEAPDGEVEDYVVDILERESPWWDLNNDRVCDLYDILIVGAHFNETGEPGWIVEDADFNGVIDLWDVLLVGEHFGETW